MNSKNSLLRAPIILVATSMCVTLTQAQVVIAKWTFETSPPADLFDSATIGSIAADEGTGTALGSHASAATDWTTPSGNGSANSLSSNTWAVGDYCQFSLETTGYSSQGGLSPYQQQQRSCHPASPSSMPHSESPSLDTARN